MRLFLLLSAALLLPVLAQAHVTANPNEGQAGKYFETKFRVSHGCDGSPTVAVHIALPKGMVSVKPQYKAGWNVDIKKSSLEKPVSAGHGKMATEQFDEIIWSGGTLPDTLYDDFGLLMKLPDAEGILWFPVKQVCKEGVSEWKNVPANMDLWHETDHPAPFVKIAPAAPAAKHQH